MTQVEILPTPFALDLHLPTSPSRSFPEKISWAANTLRFSASSPFHSPLEDRKTPLGLNTPATDIPDEGQDDVIFPDLPPLLRGHPDIHLREGVMRAGSLAADHEPDAEKAFFVADLSYVLKQHERWKCSLPDVDPFYAIKCNPDPYVLRLLAGLGTGFDCASNGEIAQVVGVGVDPSRIIFANPCKAASHIKNAAKAGVTTMTFDNTDELHKVARTHPDARLVLRILIDDSKSLCRLGLKFGAPLAAVPGLLVTARELKLNVVGISFHVGSGNFDSNAFADAVMRARTAFDMGAAAGYKFGLLDVGGGFEDATFEATAATLREALARHFPDRNGLRIIAEPGRYFVSRAFSLAANIIARRAAADSNDADSTDAACTAATAIEADSDEPTVMYYINDGVYGAFNCILFDHQTVHPRVLAMGGSFHVRTDERVQTSSVWGPTCDSIDCVCPRTHLPAALRVGDWLAFDNMGAYTVCAASQFNGFEVSQVVYTTGGGGGARETRRVLQAHAAAAISP